MRIYLIAGTVAEIREVVYSLEGIPPGGPGANALPSVSNVQASPATVPHGDTLTTTWTSTNQSSYSLYLCDATGNPVPYGGDPSGAITGIVHSGTTNASWTVPASVATGTAYKIKVVVANAAGNTAAALSPAFSVRNSAAIAFSTASSSVGEAAGAASVTMVLTTSDGQPSSQAVSVQYQTANGTAVAGFDYTLVNQTKPFGIGTVSGTPFSFNVPIIDDTLNEDGETFTVGLSGVTGGNLGAPSTQTITILDNDPLPSMSIGDVSLVEGDSGTTNAVFTVTLSPASGRTVTVGYATQNGTAIAGQDYNGTSNATVTFPKFESAAATTTQAITVPVIGNTTYQGNRTFLVNLSPPSFANLVRAQGVGTILENDAPGVSISDAAPISGAAHFAVTLQGPSNQAISVAYSTQNCTAMAPADYTAASNIAVTFQPGDVTKTVAVPVAPLATSAPNKLFKVSLSNPVNGIITRGLGYGNIINDTINPAIPPGDLSGDRSPDILWQRRDPTSGALVIWEMDGLVRERGYFLPSPTPSVLPLDWRIVGTPDLNGDGIADILWQYTGQTVGNVLRGSVGAWFMGAFGQISSTVGIPPTSGTSYPDPSTWQIVGTGDFNRDGKADILWQYTGPSVSGLPTGALYIWYLTGTNAPTPTSWAVVQPLSGWVDPAVWKIVGVADVDANGTPDIVWRSQANGSATGMVVVWLMGDVGFATRDGAKEVTYNIQGGAYQTDLNWQIVATYDMDRSGTVDLLWQNQATGEIGVWFMGPAGLPGGSWPVVCTAALYPNAVQPTTWKVFGPK